MFPIIQKSINWFSLQINWLVSIWSGTLGNGLINKLENVRLKLFNNSKVSFEYSKDMDGIYENIEEYNPNRKTQSIDCIWWYDS